MADVLSQEEIDALLTSQTAGKKPSPTPTATEGRAPVLYDFTHPDRVSKDQIRTLENIHSTFAGQLGSTFSGILRAVVDVELVSVDQFTYSEFVMSLVWPSCTYKIQLAPLEGQCLIDFGPSLSFAFIDRLFGGRGRTLEIERELSGIERSLMDIIAKRALKELGQSWKRITDVEPTIQGFEPTPQFMQIVPPGETVIATTLQVKVLERSGTITICYPYLTLEPVMENLSGQNWIEASKTGSTEEGRAVVEAGVRSVDTHVTAVLAEADITMREFLKVRVGDVIVADTKVTEPARVLVGGIQKFVGRPGMRGRHRAIEILDVRMSDEDI
ncbi:MAG TPA: flagellar motor switch protein FliM [Acidobacteriota bacterium]|nr:flagellar motor switch protein FliM [Acidobacteriota bacterium]